MSPWILIPVKSLEAGKSRLATVLNRMTRRDLNTLFLRHMLDVTSVFPGPRKTAVVSECDDVLQIVKSAGAHPIVQSGRGLNSAVEEGVARLRVLGAKMVLVMACDLPLVRSSDVRRVAAAGAENSVVISPDKHHRGTNALVVHVDVLPRFCFGEESYERHCREIVRAGMSPITHYNHRIAADIDTMRDFTWWTGMRRASFLDTSCPRQIASRFAYK